MGQRLIITENERSHINKMYGLINEQETEMSFIDGNPPTQNKNWSKGNGFFGITYAKNSIIDSVMNYWNGGNGKSRRMDFNMVEELGIPGNNGRLDSSICFNYVTENKGNSNIEIKAVSSNGDNVTSSTYTLEKDGIYVTRFCIITLPHNSTITITPNDDDKNKLVVKTKSLEK